MHALPGKFLRLKFSEMQSSAFWTLKFSKCLDSISNIKKRTCNAEIFNKPQKGRGGGASPLGQPLNPPLTAKANMHFGATALYCINVLIS